MNQQRHNPFPQHPGDGLGTLEREEDDLFFEQALSRHTQSATDPNTRFVGKIVTKQRFRTGMTILVAVLSLLLVRTSTFQLFNGAAYRAQAEENRIFHQTLVADRGVIYDRNGIVLAKNEPRFQAVTALELLPQDNYERELAIGAFATATETDARALLTLVNDAHQDDETILLLQDMTYEQAMYFASLEQHFPWLSIELGSKRSYITDGIPSLSHVLGYTGTINEQEYETRAAEGYRRFDTIGKIGLEQQYESLLRGTFGEIQMEVDALGQIERIISQTEPIDGEALHLTIDARLHAQIEEVLNARLTEEAGKASVVALDPTNGDVLALVSWPSFDGNTFVGGIDDQTYADLLADEHNPLFARAVNGEYPSGSTIKPMHAAAALIEGIITPTTTFLSTGGIQVGIWFFPDWRPAGHGVTNVYHAIADSVNTFFYLVIGGNEQIEGLGLEKTMEWDERFGFGVPTGIDLPQESIGFLPSREWKFETIGEYWYPGDTYNTSIGQGYVLVTPLQIARATAVFANGGHLVTPHLKQQTEHVLEQLIPSETAQVIKDAMRQTITAGSARYLSNLSMTSAGKTGTAQWSNDRSPHAWFTGFAPYEEPEIVLTVLVEEGSEDSLAVPIAYDIFDWWSEYREQTDE